MFLGVLGTRSLSSKEGHIDGRLMRLCPGCSTVVRVLFMFTRRVGRVAAASVGARVDSTVLLPPSHPSCYPRSGTLHKLVSQITNTHAAVESKSALGKPAPFFLLFRRYTPQPLGPAYCVLRTENIFDPGISMAESPIILYHCVVHSLTHIHHLFAKIMCCIAAWFVLAYSKLNSHWGVQR